MGEEPWDKEKMDSDQKSTQSFGWQKCKPHLSESRWMICERGNEITHPNITQQATSIQSFFQQWIFEWRVVSRWTCFDEVQARNDQGRTDQENESWHSDHFGRWNLILETLTGTIGRVERRRRNVQRREWGWRSCRHDVETRSGLRIKSGKEKRGEKLTVSSLLPK